MPTSTSSTSEQPSYTLLTLAGTRPELLKLAPVIKALQAPGSRVTTKTCFSGQHVELLESVLGGLGVVPDLDLRVGSVERTLTSSLAWILERIEAVVKDMQPDGIIVQGDTNTALAGAMVAHHCEIPSFHVEAGLRTPNPRRPFPEEMNRRLIGRMAALHFVPTQRARGNLLAEGIEPSTILLTGNTAIDALHAHGRQHNAVAEEIIAKLDPNRRRLLITLHRRENLNVVPNVILAVEQILAEHDDVEILWILHLNGIRKAVCRAFDSTDRVTLVEPQAYGTFAKLMKRADFILTDSGGVQEEAPAFGTPVLVLRDETERPEAVEAGASRIVGGDTAKIVPACRELQSDEELYRSMSRPTSPFGDGRASERIATALERYYLPDAGIRRPESVRPDSFPESILHSLPPDAGPVEHN